MKNNILSTFPSPLELQRIMKDVNIPEFREANGHIHTPYSFSAFTDLGSLFKIAKRENISLLGINDFYVTDGYKAFYEGCISNNIFPLFNIEFIGLMKDEQNRGIRINDPNNPGRIYFSGKGLDFPFHLNESKTRELDEVRNETQKQLESMVLRINELISKVDPGLRLNLKEIKERYAHDLVRERHLAKALRFLALESYRSDEERVKFIEALYGGKKSKAGFSDPAALENEIRSNLLKAGGAAFVAEDEHSFFELKTIIDIILDAGGIPCYPVLLDDAAGKFTEFESEAESLFRSLDKLNIFCIELIPGRNDLSILKSFVAFFDSKGFVITFGTEHNTPEMIPLTVNSRGKKQLDDSLRKVAWRGSSVIAAHQYLRSQNNTGYINENGAARVEEKPEFESLGRSVIEYYLNNS